MGASARYHLCRAEVENGLFTDQKWMNFAPVFFDGVAIVKSSAPQRRDLEPDDAPDDRRRSTPVSRSTASRSGFYHFTGFDSGAHRIMAIKNASGEPGGAAN